MSRLQLDFARRPRLKTGTALVLIIGALGLGQALLTRDRLLANINDQESRHHRLERQLHLLNTDSRQPVATADPKAELAVAQISHELTLPWEDVLNALQRASDATITVQRIQPDAKSGQVQVTGHAANSEAFLRYLTTLGKDSSHWSHIQPLSEEPDATQPDKPLSFSLVATWRLP